MRIGYALTTLLSAFLLFQVQPLIARCILPWFGGTPDTWTACLLFFQVTLLAGYLYAQWLARRATPARQAIIHAALLLAALAFLPIIPSTALKPSGPQAPVWRIVMLLAATVGLPYFALSATAPLLQSWLAQTGSARPYRLYALSNLGSLLALLTYPTLFEPLFRIRTQAWLWSAGFGVFVAACSFTAVCFRQCAAAADRTPAGGAAPEAPPKPGAMDVFLWLAFAACGSIMLLAATNQLSQNVAVVPLLWVVPLALYLLTFVICFHSGRWYRRGLVVPLFVALALLAVYALQRGAALSLFRQAAACCGALFAVCLLCHGELARLKPHPRFLTCYYVVLSAGGALGGFFVAIVAPRAFTMLAEYDVGLALCALLAMVVYYRDRWRVPPALRSRLAWPLVYVLVLAVAGAAALVNEARNLADQYGRKGSLAGAGGGRAPAMVLARSRNFYGTLTVLSRRQGDGVCRSLINGSILHGQQYTGKPLSLIPQAYYGTDTGLATALRQHPRRRAGNPEDRRLRIGNVGMGIGTLAAYGQPGDRIRFYEINPDVARFALEYFTCVSDSPAAVDVVLGDGRMSLEREIREHRPDRYDVLVVDAFNGGAVPMHLLTRECFATYNERLAHNGILAFHVSGRFLDVTPVVTALCGELGLSVFGRDTPADAAAGTLHAYWLLASRNREFTDLLRAQPEYREQTGCADARMAWTDDYGSLLSVLRRNSPP